MTTCHSGWINWIALQSYPVPIEYISKPIRINDKEFTIITKSKAHMNARRRLWKFNTRTNTWIHIPNLFTDTYAHEFLHHSTTFDEQHKRIFVSNNAKLYKLNLDTNIWQKVFTGGCLLGSKIISIDDKIHIITASLGNNKHYIFDRQTNATTYKDKIEEKQLSLINSTLLHMKLRKSIIFFGPYKAYEYSLINHGWNIW
eukprot:236685_1